MENITGNNITLEELKEYKSIVSKIVSDFEIMTDSRMMDKVLTTASEDPKYQETINFYIDLMHKCGDLIDVAEAVNNSYKPTKRDKIFKTVAEKDPNHKFSWNIDDLQEIKAEKIKKFNDMLAKMDIPLEKGIGVTKTEVLFNLLLAQIVKSNIRKIYRKKHHMRSTLYGDIQENSNKEVESILYEDLKNNEFNDEELHQLYVSASRNLPKIYRYVCDLFIEYTTKMYQMLHSANKTNESLSDIIRQGTVPSADSEILTEVLDFGKNYDDELAYILVAKEDLEYLIEISTEMLNLCADKILGPKVKYVKLSESDLPSQGK